MQHMGTQLNPKAKVYEFGSVVLITHFSCVIRMRIPIKQNEMVTAVYTNFMNWCTNKNDMYIYIMWA